MIAAKSHLIVTCLTEVSNDDGDHCVKTCYVLMPIAQFMLQVQRVMIHGQIYPFGQFVCLFELQ